MQESAVAAVEGVRNRRRACLICQKIPRPRSELNARVAPPPPAVHEIEGARRHTRGARRTPQAPGTFLSGRRMSTRAPRWSTLR